MIFLSKLLMTIVIRILTQEVVMCERERKFDVMLDVVAPVLGISIALTIILALSAALGL